MLYFSTGVSQLIPEAKKHIKGRWGFNVTLETKCANRGSS